MKKQITTLILGIIFIASAMAIYSGETFYYELTGDIENLQNFSCKIINNSYNLDGLNFTENETGFIISTEINYKPDNFNISCLLNGNKNVVVDSGSSNGGSSGGSTACYVNWTCSEWSSCDNNLQKRTCEKIPKYCFANPTEKPKEIKSCQIKIDEPKEDKTEINDKIIENNENFKKLNNYQKYWIFVLSLFIITIVWSSIEKFFINKKENNINDGSL